MADENKKELTITRTFDAPRELVWKAWTDPKIVQRWWGPNGVTNPTCEWDVRQGGKIHIVMLAGKELGEFEGHKWPMKGTFTQVKPLSRISYRSDALDEKSETFLTNEVTIDFEEVGDKTRMVLRVVVTKAVGQRAEFALQGMSYGFNQQTDKLEALLRELK